MKVMEPGIEFRRRPALWASGLLLGLAVLSSVSPSCAGQAPPAEKANRADGLIASPEEGWPQWRGPRRDGISHERGLLAKWPATGPPLLWKAEGIGRGWSSPIITGGAIFITGDVGTNLVVFSLDLRGRLNWQSTNGLAWTGSYPGARACCAFFARGGLSPQCPWPGSRPRGPRREGALGGGHPPALRRARADLGLWRVPAGGWCEGLGYARWKQGAHGRTVLL